MAAIVMACTVGIIHSYVAHTAYGHAHPDCHHVHAGSWRWRARGQRRCGFTRSIGSWARPTSDWPMPWGPTCRTWKKQCGPAYLQVHGLRLAAVYCWQKTGAQTAGQHSVCTICLAPYGRCRMPVVPALLLGESATPANILQSSTVRMAAAQ